MQFPIYIGYITLGKDRTFTFTKETDHPIELLEEQLKKIEMTGDAPVLRHRPQAYPDLRTSVNIHDKEFTEELTWVLRFANVEIIAFLYEGEAKHSTYSFKEHCIYDINNFNKCKNIKDFFENTIVHKKNE